jgi:outer membrane protein OmpA-like peptidoglycan-associated protein
MHRPRLSTGLAGLLGAFIVATSAGGATLKDHPLIKPYPGSVLTASQDRGFSEFKIVTGTDAAGATDDEKLQNVLVPGNLTRLSYESPRDRSVLEVSTNYKEALEQAGFGILFACADAQCGPLRQVIGRLNGTKLTSPEMRFLTASRTQGDRETYVQINMIKLRHEIYVLERTEMERGLVAVTPEAIKQGLLVDGRVVLDGILFDFDKATLKAESKPALDAIAKFLADNPALKAFIVGHTDGTGQIAHNMQLSKDRAAAVVTALVNDYRIAAARLVAHGVGPLSPARTNKNEEGRAENRRVEMVEM